MPFGGGNVEGCEHERNPEQLQAFINDPEAKARPSPSWIGMPITAFAQNAAQDRVAIEVEPRADVIAAAQIIFRASILSQLCW